MLKAYNKQIELMLGMAVQDIEQTGDMSIRLMVIKPDGTEFMFPPPQTIGISLNLESHSARMLHKRTMQLQVENGDIIAGMLLYNSMITKPGDLVDNPNDKSIYLLCMTIDGKTVIRQDYTIDETGKPVLGKKTVYEHDPEQSQIVYGANVEILMSYTDEQFAAIPEESWVGSIPKEWVDYVHRERQNRDSDEWSYAATEPIHSPPLAKKGGNDEVSTAEETV